jgi:hypothetical protein
LRPVLLNVVHLQIVLCISVLIVTHMWNSAILVCYDVLTCRLSAILVWNPCSMP